MIILSVKAAKHSQISTIVCLNKAYMYATRSRNNVRASASTYVYVQ